jgi:hypothetical protein
MPRKKVDEVFIEITPEIAIRDFKWLCKGINIQKEMQRRNRRGPDI